MYLKRSSKVQLQANKKYEGFHYSSIPVKVKQNLVLEANCSEEGRLEDIFNSLKKQFKEKDRCYFRTRKFHQTISFCDKVSFDGFSY